MCVCTSRHEAPLAVAAGARPVAPAGLEREGGREGGRERGEAGTGVCVWWYLVPAYISMCPTLVLLF